MARVWGVGGGRVGAHRAIDGRGERHSVYLDPSAPHRVVLYLRAVGSVLVTTMSVHTGAYSARGDVLAV